jgi:hypothetical protein
MTFGLIASLLFALLVAALLCAGAVAAWLTADDAGRGRLYDQEDSRKG